MFSKHLLNGIRREKIKRDNQPIPIIGFVFEAYGPSDPSFFIEWNKKSGQFKIVNKKDDV